MTKSLSIIKSDEQYEDYMSELTKILDEGMEDGSESFDRFELLSLLIENYESKHHPIEKPSPIEAIKFRMDQLGLTQADMTNFLGNKSKVSEVLNEKIPLSLSMIKRIHEGLGISFDILLQESERVEWSELELTEAKPADLDFKWDVYLEHVVKKDKLEPIGSSIFGIITNLMVKPVTKKPIEKRSDSAVTNKQIISNNSAWCSV